MGDVDEAAARAILPQASTPATTSQPGVPFRLLSAMIRQRLAERRLSRMAQEKTTTQVPEAKRSDLDSHVRPFLKWAGGKRQLLPQIRRFYPEHFGAYYEPFVGSGALFFDLYTRGLLAGRKAVLVDNNADLVGCYLMVRDQVDAVIRHLTKLALAYRTDPRAHYYTIRDKQFNPERQRIFNGDRPKSSRYTPALAAKLIYLNRTGFNGLFRLNSQGQFNVPLGRYTNPQICDRQNLRRVALALAETRADIRQAPFETVLDSAKPGDFVYFDPPYAPLSRTALFTSYTADRFSPADQQRLQHVTIELARRGCWVLLSNSTAPEIADLYDGNREAEAVGLSAYKVPAKRAINSDATGRGQILEYLISNLPRHDEIERCPIAR